MNRIICKSTARVFTRGTQHAPERFARAWKVRSYMIDHHDRFHRPPCYRAFCKYDIIRRECEYCGYCDALVDPSILCAKTALATE